MCWKIKRRATGQQCPGNAGERWQPRSKYRKE
nr:MAG TPA: hypothetical protein [Caudoviricetes sp.]